MQRRSKKGFTLAELLIVVAIIAVLTAIAVPLFVSSLDKADKAVFDSNKSAVKSAGIVAILSDEKYDLSALTAEGAKASELKIAVKGTFSGADLTKVEILSQTPEKAPTTAETNFTDWKGEGNNKTEIVVWLSATEVTGYTTA